MHKLDLLLQALDIFDPYAPHIKYQVFSGGRLWFTGSYYDCVDWVSRCQSGLVNPCEIFPCGDNR